MRCAYSDEGQHHTVHSKQQLSSFLILRSGIIPLGISLYLYLTMADGCLAAKKAYLVPEPIWPMAMVANDLKHVTVEFNPCYLNVITHFRPPKVVRSVVSAEETLMKKRLRRLYMQQMKDRKGSILPDLVLHGD